MFIHIAKSDTLDMTTGVPQGCILGPLLFIIYIVMTYLMPATHFTLFCMHILCDTYISASLQSVKTIRHNAIVDTLINKELNKISQINYP